MHPENLFPIIQPPIRGALILPKKPKKKEEDDSPYKFMQPALGRPRPNLHKQITPLESAMGVSDIFSNNSKLDVSGLYYSSQQEDNDFEYVQPPATIYQLEKRNDIFKSLEANVGSKLKKRKIKKNRKLKPLNPSPRLEDDDRYREYKKPLPFQAFPDRPFKRKTFFDIMDDRDRSDSREKLKSKSPEKRKSNLPEILDAVSDRPKTTALH